VGIHPERDDIRNVVLQGCTAKDTQVSEIVFSRPACVAPDQTVAEWMVLMNRKWVRYLPGVENDSVLGFISIGDAVQASLSTTIHHFR